MLLGLFPHQWNIRAKSIALVVVYVLALYGVYGSFTLYLVRREATEAQDRFEQTARMVAAQLDTHIESGQQRLAAVAKLPGLSYGLSTMLETQEGGYLPAWTTLHYIFLQSPVFTGGMFLLDRAGKVVWTEPPGLPLLGHTVTDTPILDLYQQDHGLVSTGIGADHFLARPHVIIAAPIRNPDGGVEGILGGVIDLTGSALVNILGGVSTVRDRFVEVVDQNGCVLASTRKDRLLQPLSLEANQKEAFLTASVTLSQAPWRVLSGQPRHIALADVSRLHHFLWWAGFGMILLAIAGGAPFINGLVVPIKKLTLDAERMASGNLSQPVTVGRGQDEIATLAHAFEHMRVELERSRTALEQQLKEREELIRMKEEFLANISHELRTPLHVIMGYSDMLFEQESDELKRSMVAHVRTKSNQLFRLISDLMTVSGLNTGKIALQVGPVVVADLVARLLALAKQLRQGKDIEVIWDCPSPLPQMKTDGLRLEQILTNLVTNAIKFTQKGQIIIRTRQASSQDLMILEVADTGIGIPTEELPLIFDEFHQVDGSISRLHGGIGLGLALVKKLVALLHGEISVVSQPGKGSTFTVTLPLQLSSHKPECKELDPPTQLAEAPDLANGIVAEKHA